MLKNAGKLRLLDLRGCAHLTSTGLQQLTATHLESLFISQSSVAKYDGIEIVMQKASLSQSSETCCELMKSVGQPKQSFVNFPAHTVPAFAQNTLWTRLFAEQYGVYFLRFVVPAVCRQTLFECYWERERL